MLLADGTELPADVVIVGVGITPNIELARSCGLNVDNGILTDEHLRTSDNDILAAGDVANAYHPLLGRQLRVEHWANALHQPAVAAKTMLGQTATYDRLPYFFTDQYDLGMEYLGYTDPDGYDQVVIRGDTASREFIAFWLHRRARGGRDERQRVGRDRADPGSDPIRRAGRCEQTERPRHPADPAAPMLNRCHPPGGSAGGCGQRIPPRTDAADRRQAGLDVLRRVLPLPHRSPSSQGEGVQPPSPLPRAASWTQRRSNPLAARLPTLRATLEHERDFRRDQLARLDPHEGARSAVDPPVGGYHRAGSALREVDALIAAGARRALDDIELAMARMHTAATATAARAG